MHDKDRMANNQKQEMCEGDTHLRDQLCKDKHGHTRGHNKHKYKHNTV